MQIVGITAEYNPFHTGHAYQIRKAREKAKADLVIVVLSSTVMQRGSFQAFPRSQRALWAVEAGADLVLELPYVYSGQSAAYFAEGAVRTLLEAGATAISFGAEDAEKENFLRLAKLLNDEPEWFQERLKEGLAEGLRFPAARERAVAEREPELSRLLKSPNNILGIEYTRALLREGSDADILPVRRQGAGYHDEKLDADFASASALRENLDVSGSENYLPQGLARTRENRIESEREKLMLLAAGRILTLEAEELALYPGIDADLANRMSRLIREEDFSDIDDLIDALVTKDQTASSIRRGLMSLIAGLTRSDLHSFYAPYYSPYLRVLAMSPEGQRYLKEHPMMTTPSTQIDTLAPMQRRAFELEDRLLSLQGLVADNTTADRHAFGPGAQFRSCVKRPECDTMNRKSEEKETT